MSEILSNPVIEAILSRRSIRSYKQDPVTQEQMDTILACGNWAPSAMNLQTTILVASSDRAMFAELQDDMQKNGGIGAPPPARLGQTPPPPQTPNRFCYDTPSFIFVYGDSSESRYQVNAALAVENMCIAAESLGLSTVIIGAIRPFLNSEYGQKWRKRFGVPDGYEFVCGITVGYGTQEGTKHPRREGTIIKI